MKNNVLKEYVDLYSENIVKIIKYWISDKRVQKILKKHGIKQKYFVRTYAINIALYFIDIIKDEENKNNNSVFDELIIFLKEKEISSSELFTICSSFKNALIEYSYDEEIINFELEKEIIFLFEQNFTQVLQEYSDSITYVQEKLIKSSDIVDKYVIMSKTDDKGIIKSVSQAFCDISGYKEDELIGKSHNIIKHPDTPKELFVDLWSTIKSGQAWHGEIKNRKKDGSFYWVNLIITPNFDEDKNIIGYEAIREDISSQKELEEQQNILVEQSKSAAMGEMISMIAHQWRQPLQAVSILIQKLPLTKTIEGEISDELLEQVVADVGLQLEYMSKTIDDFRDFFLPNKPKDSVEISTIVNKAIEFLSIMLSTDSIEVKVDSRTNQKILVHTNELIQVFINIIKNARDVMFERGIEKKEININFFDKDKFIVIEIEDNAGGIDEKNLKKIFDPYFSTKSNKNGTGLGLYMCKTIIEKHSSGNFLVQNSKNGAKFIIELPIS